MSIQGERIRALRKELGFTQDQLAQACGYTSKAAINLVESGFRDMSLSKLRNCAAALGTTKEYLMGKTDNPVRPPLQDEKDKYFDKVREKTFSSLIGENSKELCERFYDLSADNQNLVLKTEKYLQNANSVQIDLLDTILDANCLNTDKQEELLLSITNIINSALKQL